MITSIKNKFQILTLIVTLILCFTGCSKISNPNMDGNQNYANMPNIIKSSKSYIVDNKKFSRVKISNDEYLLAFYGRIDGESEEENRIIYINKYNEIVKDFAIPVEVNLSIYDLYFGEKFVMMVNRQYSGVDNDGNIHGVIIFDTDGNLIANYEPRDPNIFTGVDYFTRFNIMGYSWCEMDKTIVFNTPFAIYEYNTENNILMKLVGLEDIIPNLDYNALFDGIDYLDIFVNKYGFYYMFRSDEKGIIFSVNENLEKAPTQYTSSEKYTVYSLKNGDIIPLTHKNECQGVLQHSGDGSCLIYTNSDKKSYIIDNNNIFECKNTASSYKLNIYSVEHNFTPLIIEYNNSASYTSLSYFDSVNNKYYATQIDSKDVTIGDATYNYPFIAYGEYVYFDTDKPNDNDICYRLNTATGKGEFVYGSVEYLPLCSEYRIFEDGMTIPGMTKISIFKDCAL